MAKTKGKDTICLGVEVPIEWNEKLIEIAKKKGINVKSIIIRHALKEYLEKHG